MTAPDPRGGVEMSILTDIYQMLLTLSAKVENSLARSEATDKLVAEHDADLRALAGVAKQAIDHEARIRAIERSRWPITSLTVLISLAGVAIAVAAIIVGK